MVDKAAYLSPPDGRASRFARLVSNVINPVFVGIYIAGVLTFQAIEDRGDATLWFGLTVLLAALPPVTYVFYLVRIGYLADFFMPNREKRIKPVTVIIMWMVFLVILLEIIGGPLAITLILTATMVQIGLLLAITFLWKISFHTAIITLAATILVLRGGGLSWTAFTLVPLVGWSRVWLRRHTKMEVTTGAVAGGLVAIIAYNLIALSLGL